MQRLKTRLQTILDQATRNQIEIEDLLRDVETLDIVGHDIVENVVPGSWLQHPGNAGIHTGSHRFWDVVNDREDQYVQPSQRAIFNDFDSGSTDTHQRIHYENTASDSMIATLLNEFDNDLDTGTESQSSWNPVQYQFPDTFDDIGFENVEERLETAIAIAIVDSLDEIAETISSISQPTSINVANTAWPVTWHEIALMTGQNSGSMQQQNCPICLHPLIEPPPTDEERSNNRRVDEDFQEQVFCPACTQPFHSTCLGRWFREERDSILCPHCRTEMDISFVETFF